MPGQTIPEIVLAPIMNRLIASARAVAGYTEVRYKMACGPLALRDSEESACRSGAPARPQGHQQRRAGARMGWDDRAVSMRGRWVKVRRRQGEAVHYTGTVSGSVRTPGKKGDSAAPSIARVAISISLEEDALDAMANAPDRSRATPRARRAPYRFTN